MKIQTTQQPKKNKSKKGQKLTPEQQFQRVWQKVLKAKQRNQKIKQEVESFAEKISQQIESQERQHSEALYSNTEQLIQFFTRKSLSQWQRHELYNWIHNNLQILSYHPFTDHLDMPALLDQFHQAMPVQEFEDDSDFFNEEEVDAQAPDDEQGHTGQGPKEDVDNTMDMFEELFGEFSDTDKEEETTGAGMGEDDFFEQFYEEMFERQQAYEKERQQEVQELDQILKSSSINKMFRKIASRLHPDREQDPEKKAEKHQQMSQLVDARDQRDVLTLFALYEEHIGEPFDQLIDTDHKRLTTLLKHQLTMLEQEREQLIEENPKAAMIYHRFHNRTKAKVNAEVKDHLNSLEASTRELETFSDQVTSLKKLKPYLEARYDMNAGF